MENSTLTLYMEGYLAQFLTGYFGGTGDSIKIRKDSFIGELLYDQLQIVPEDCIFRPTNRTDKKQPLKVEVGFLGTSARKNPNHYFYLPKSKQLLIEKQVRFVFDELLCLYLANVTEKTESEIKSLIENFCEKYGIDFASYYDTLKKKYFRARTQKSSCISVPRKK
jgi:hypothetical protein